MGKNETHATVVGRPFNVKMAKEPGMDTSLVSFHSLLVNLYTLGKAAPSPLAITSIIWSLHATRKMDSLFSTIST
jgi:hypothetical protein